MATGTRLSISVRGVKAVAGRFARLAPETRARIALTLKAAGDSILRNSRPYVPFENGHLYRSGSVAEPVFVSFNGPISVEISYGQTGPSREYALAVHEHISRFSPPTWLKAEAVGGGVNFHMPGTGPKYLEIPFKEEAARIVSRFANARVLPR